MKVTPVTDLDIFGGKTTDLLPSYESIPDEFKKLFSSNKWVKLVSDWFYSGLKNIEATPRQGVNAREALRHVQAILGSFEPKHEHKIAGCAYLMSEFFEDVKYEKRGGSSK